MSKSIKRVVTAFLKKQSKVEPFENAEDVESWLDETGNWEKWGKKLFAEAEKAVPNYSDSYCDKPAFYYADHTQGDFVAYYDQKRDRFIFGGNGGVFIEYDDGEEQESGWAAYIAFNRKGKIVGWEFFIPWCGEGAYIEKAEEMIERDYRKAIRVY